MSVGYDTFPEIPNKIRGLFADHEGALLENKRNYVMEQVYYGSSFTNSQIKQYLGSNNIASFELSNNELLNHAAEGINKGKFFGSLRQDT